METVLVLVTAALFCVVIAMIILNTRRRAVEAQLHDDVRELREQAEVSNTLATTYSSAIAGAPIAIALMDSSGNVTGTNPLADDLLGGGQGAVLRSQLSALAKRVSEDGASEHVESHIHDPIRRVLTITAVPLGDDADARGGVVVYIVDMSDQKRIDAMRTDFVANASHELKTPLGALSILAETLSTTDDEIDRARLAGRLRSEAIRMARVIDDVVRLAETESLGIEFERVSVADFVDDAADDVATLAASKGVDLVRGEVVDGAVMASPEQMMSAVRNLLENAITYTAVKDAGGTVIYRARRDGDLVCIEVEDTGVGIPERYLDRVFERFFRVDRARSRESGGTGLGLSIVKNVAQAHGGSVRLTSEVGIGSTFAICLPEASEEQR